MSMRTFIESVFVYFTVLSLFCSCITENGSSVKLGKTSLDNLNNYDNVKLDIKDFELIKVGDKKIEENKAVLIDFWATWCGPCIAYFPDLERIQEKYKRDIQIVSISDEDTDTVLKFLENNKIDLTFYNDIKGDLFKKLRIEDRPTYCLISRVVANYDSFYYII